MGENGLSLNSASTCEMKLINSQLGAYVLINACCLQVVFRIKIPVFE